MAIYVTSCPQNVAEIKTTTLKDVVRILPNYLPESLNVWISGKIVQFGRTDGNLVFMVESEQEPSGQLKQQFDSFILSLGIHATVTNHWRNQQFVALRLYDNGQLIIDKDTLQYTKIPSATKEPAIVTCKEVLSKLPETITWPITLYLTGGIVRCGWSVNDLDIITFEQQNRLTLVELRNFFTNLFGWKTDVGFTVMSEREPVYLYKIYEKGIKCPM